MLKRRVTKRTSTSPRSILARNRKSSFSKTFDLETSPRKINGRTKSALPKNSRQTSKYSRYALLPPSTEPFEKSCFERDPLLPGYAFVPKGDVYITRHCRSKTKESQQMFYVVYDNAGKRSLGLRVPSDIYAEVLNSAAATAELRANAVRLRDRRDIARARQHLCLQFPLMPVESLEMILDHAFLKGSGRVGRTSMKSDERKAILAVEAHIRHLHTPYEALLDAGMTRQQAREAVWDTVQAIKAGWEGGESQPMHSLTLRMHSLALPSVG
ncbi:Uncharacterized conserved protein DUF2293 [Aspergillus sclerotialis]|uniref:Uncharacterized conserved protein DUF2293 n=1 Tax=Aspergillus sclerotialis TaxID=2070753 RepID=A0A3A2ZUW4_9EURO|nr:Uncharacterized conserved protein DUF2293 [Aspergillus sclerotialis]